MNLLAKIVESKREEMRDNYERFPLEALRREALEEPQQPSLIHALRSVPIGLIAEIKRRSPTAGPIREHLDPANIARIYEAAGAQAISVLIDNKFFGGSEADFIQAREVVRLPMLYKEFVVDPWQIWHARSIGASAVLLITAVLKPLEMKQLMELCQQAGLEALIEVHDEAEMATAISLGATFIGINNRDLRTFRTQLETSLKLIPMAPPGSTIVSESGIKTANDVAALRSAGAHGVLVGESLLRAGDIAQTIHELIPPAESNT